MLLDFSNRIPLKQLVKTELVLCFHKLNAVFLVSQIQRRIFLRTALKL
jgi:hypothetical protein